MKFHVVFNGAISHIWQGDKIARAFQLCLRELGHEASIGTYANEGEPDEVLVIIAAEGSAAVEGDWNGPVWVYNLSEAYLFGAAQWWTQFINSAKRWTNPRIDVVLDYSPQNDNVFLEELGVPTWIFCPLGYHETFDREIADEAYDVGFLGKIAIGSRRELMLDQLPKCLTKAIYQYQRPKKRGMKKWGWNEDEDLEVLRSSVFLHIHTFKKGRNFPAPRIIQIGLSNGLAVVTEECDWYPSGLEPGVHFETFKHGDPVDMERVVVDLLKDPHRRQEIQSEGWAWASQEWRFADKIEQTLEGLLR